MYIFRHIAPTTHDALNKFYFCSAFEIFRYQMVAIPSLH